MAVVYYVTWMDPNTGFLERVEFDDHSKFERFKAELRKKRIEFTSGHFER